MAIEFIGYALLYSYILFGFIYFSFRFYRMFLEKRIFTIPDIKIDLMNQIKLNEIFDEISINQIEKI